MPEDDYLVTRCCDLPGHGAHLIPHLVSFLEVLTHPLVAAIAAGLDTSTGERGELDVWVIEVQKRVKVTAPDRVEALPDNLDILLRHGVGSISPD